MKEAAIVFGLCMVVLAFSILMGLVIVYKVAPLVREAAFSVLKPYELPPCDHFKNGAIKNVPADCYKYFLENGLDH